MTKCKREGKPHDCCSRLLLDDEGNGNDFLDEEDEEAPVEEGGEGIKTPGERIDNFLLLFFEGNLTDLDD